MELHHEPAPGGGALLRLAGELTIYDAAALKTALLALPPADGDWRLDLGDVTDVDSAGIQLLLALKRTLAARGAVLRLGARSAAMKAALSLYGMADAFDAAAD